MLPPAARASTSLDRLREFLRALGPSRGRRGGAGRPPFDLVMIAGELPLQETIERKCRRVAAHHRQLAAAFFAAERSALASQLAAADRRIAEGERRLGSLRELRRSLPPERLVPVDKDRATPWTAVDAASAAFFFMLSLGLAGAAWWTASTALVFSGVVETRLGAISLASLSLGIPVGCKALSLFLSGGAARRRYFLLTGALGLAGTVAWVVGFWMVYAGSLTETVADIAARIGAGVAGAGPSGIGAGFLAAGALAEGLLSATAWAALAATCDSHRSVSTIVNPDLDAVDGRIDEADSRLAKDLAARAEPESKRAEIDAAVEAFVSGAVAHFRNCQASWTHQYTEFRHLSDGPEAAEEELVVPIHRRATGGDHTNNGAMP